MYLFHKSTIKPLWCPHWSIVCKVACVKCLVLILACSQIPYKKLLNWNTSIVTSQLTCVTYVQQQHWSEVWNSFNCRKLTLKMAVKKYRYCIWSTANILSKRAWKHTYFYSEILTVSGHILAFSSKKNLVFFDKWATSKVFEIK